VKRSKKQKLMASVSMLRELPMGFERRTIVIDQRGYEALVANVPPGRSWDETKAFKRQDGLWEITVSTAVYDHLKANAWPGETHSDVLVRMILGTGKH
jgi:hypothetical protein